MTNLCVSVSLRNTGGNKCDVVLEAFTRMMPSEMELSADDLADETSVMAALRAATLLSRDAPGKLFVFPSFSDATDNTPAPAEETLGDGRKQYGYEAAPSYALEYPLGMCQALAIRAFDNYRGRAYVIANGNLLLYEKTASGGGRGLSISSLKTSIVRPGAFTGKHVVTTNISFADVREWDNLGAIRLGPQSELIAQEDVELFEADAATGYVFTIGSRTACIGIETYDAYADQLNDPDMWKVTRLDTGATVVVSGTAKVAAKKAWALTLANSPTIPEGTRIRFELDLEAMQAEEIMGIESLAVIALKPA